MKMSRRALRMQRHHKRSASRGGLNMVSLMDIFTILVFFLLLHSSDVEVLPSAKAVKLPESIAEKQPKQTVVVVVNDTEIIVQGRKVAAVADVMNAGADIIEPLKAELDHQAKLGVGLKRGQAADAKTGREVTIMGDKEIPYSLLKKIMLTCVRSSYDNISLAVLKKTPA